MWADPDRQTGSIAEKNLKRSHREIQDCCTTESESESEWESRGERERESMRDATADSLVEAVLAVLPIYLDSLFFSQKTNSLGNLTAQWEDWPVFSL